MKNSKDQSHLEKFLEFNGKRISILRNDGEWWVALRPVLDALNVDADWHLRAVKSHEILGQHLSEHTGVAADGKARKMLCLPEKYMYGWLFTIDSASEDLKTYKEKCYEVLYNHFHGALTGRMKILEERADYNAEIEKLQEELLQSEPYKKMEELKKKRTQATASLRKMDLDLTHGQMTFNF